MARLFTSHQLWGVGGGGWQVQWPGCSLHISGGGGGRYNGQVVHFTPVVGWVGVAGTMARLFTSHQLWGGWGWQVQWPGLFTPHYCGVGGGGRYNGQVVHFTPVVGWVGVAQGGWWQVQWPGCSLHTSCGVGVGVAGTMARLFTSHQLWGGGGGRYNGQVVHFTPVVGGGGGRYNGQVVHFTPVVGWVGWQVQWPGCSLHTSCGVGGVAGTMARLFTSHQLWGGWAGRYNGQVVHFTPVVGWVGWQVQWPGCSLHTSCGVGGVAGTMARLFTSHQLWGVGGVAGTMARLFTSHQLWGGWGGRYNGQVVHFTPVVGWGGGRYNGQVVHFTPVVGGGGGMAGTMARLFTSHQLWGGGGGRYNGQVVHFTPVVGWVGWQVQWPGCSLHTSCGKGGAWLLPLSSDVC